MSTTATPVPVLEDGDAAIAAARAYAASIAAGAAERDRAGLVPRSELAALDASGLLGITIPRAHGGAGLGPGVLGEVVATIAAVDPAIAQVPQAHWLMVDVLAVWGSDAQRARLYAEVLAGGRIASALAERGGRHAQDLSTRLQDGALQGRKYYCTGALTASWIAVSALGDGDGLLLAFVARDTPGVRCDEDWNVMGQRATVSGSTTLHDVAVDPGLVVDYARAFVVPQQLGARAQLVHAAIEVGIARGALDDTARYLRERARPSTEAVREGATAAVQDPHVLWRFGRSATQVRAAEALLAQAAATVEDVGLVPADEQAAARGSLAVAAAKAFASEVAVQVASDLFALCGASAADARHDLDRHWRNARTHSVHDPVDWKYRHMGAYELAGVQPPNHAQL
jgi:SfnB family sulfur acquisition oxidoreductase